MRVEPLMPDVAVPAPTPARSTFGALVDAAGDALQSADAAERAFIGHRGGLAEMIVERARADIALQIAASGAQRAAQSLQTVLGMQI
jgi:flagellar hook-basal body complex protein FliE